MGLFGKTHEKDPKEQVNEWCHKIRKEGYQLDRQIRSIEREEDKVKKALKEAAKKNDKDVCITLAKEIVNARKHITKIHTSKAHLNSIQLQMKNQLSLLRVSGSIQKSTEVMQAMQRLVNVPEVAATMREMSKEMMKAGIMEEMIEETMESIEPDVEDMEEQAQEEIDKVREEMIEETLESIEPDVEDMEELAQEEIDKVLWELTAGALGKVPAVGTDTPSSTKEKHEEAVGGVDEEEDQDDLEAMKSRLEALRS